MANKVSNRMTNDSLLIDSFKKNIEILEKEIDKTIENMDLLAKEKIDISFLETKLERLKDAGSTLVKQFEGELKRIRDK